jgi:hypothetical protein
LLTKTKARVTCDGSDFRNPAHSFSAAVGREDHLVYARRVLRADRVAAILALVT